MSRLFSLILVFVSFLAGAQHLEKVVFNSQTHNFGSIAEEAGPVTHEFRFKNTGTDSLLIAEVNASCGCTTPSWSKESIAPGDSGFVQAQYNPMNRPGPFNKNLTVTFSSIESPIQLFIRGNVTPSPGSVEEEFSNKIGGIRLKYQTFNMGKVLTTDEPSEKVFEVYNDSDTIITFLDRFEKPAHVQVRFEPQQVAPGEKAQLIVTYDAKSKNDFGFNSDNLTFYTDEPEGAQRKSVNLYATIEEYFPPMSSEELKTAPHMAVKDPMHDFEKVKPGDRVTTTFTLINTGQGTLEIRQVKGNCACIVATVDRMSLEPGETANVEVTFDATDRLGNQQKSVTVYSNDPMAPAQRMTVRAYVE